MLLYLVLKKWYVFSSIYNSIGGCISISLQMPELESLFEKSLSPSSQVIACRFPLPNWKPSHVIGEGIDRVWVYEI